MQIKLTNKPINTELNHFIMRNNLQPTPKRHNANHNAPLVQPQPLLQPQPQHQPLPFKENQPLINNMNRSPARSTSRKALQSKEESMFSITSNDSYGYSQSKNRRSTTSLHQRKCQNHDQIIGDYHINIQGEDLYYCEKCAMKLKNQGFPIKKEMKGQTNSTKSLLPATKVIKNNLQHAYPNLKGHPQFQALKDLLTNIYSIEQNMKNAHNLNQVQQIFMKKQMQVQSFYGQLQKLIRQKKTQSKNTLAHLKDTWLQTTQQKSQTFAQSLSQISMMKNDIQNNIQSIVGQVQQQTFKECVQNYQERLQSYEKLIMDKHNDFNKINQSLDGILDHVVNGFQNDMIRIKEESYCFGGGEMRMNQSLDSGYSCKEDINGPFRRLFQNHNGNFVQNQDRSDKSNRKRLISKK